MEEEILGVHFALEVQDEGVIEGHVVPVPSEDDEVVAKDDASVAVSGCWALSLGLAVVVGVEGLLGIGLGHVHASIDVHGTLPCQRGLVMDLLPLLHVVVVLVEAGVCVLYDEGVHH